MACSLFLRLKSQSPHPCMPCTKPLTRVCRLRSTSLRGWLRSSPCSERGGQPVLSVLSAIELRKRFPVWFSADVFTLCLPPQPGRTAGNMSDPGGNLSTKSRSTRPGKCPGLTRHLRRAGSLKAFRMPVRIE
jgi:hypothetical protein